LKQACSSLAPHTTFDKPAAEEPVSRCEFEVALSFAGEDRAYVEMVARFLKAHGLSLFYDEDLQTSLWGKDLYSHLSSVYSHSDALAKGIAAQR
jgi:hypothetical protein